MTHYLMVAKLSKRCFDLVLEIPQRINRKVTQGDFIHLCKKTEEEQHKILSDLLNNCISLQDVKRRKVSQLNSLKTNVHRHFMVLYGFFNKKLIQLTENSILNIAWKGVFTQRDGKYQQGMYIKFCL